MRQNIFEQIKSSWNVSDAIKRIYKLFLSEKTVYYSDGYRRYNVPLFNFIDVNCFALWKNNCHMLGLRDFLDSLHFDELYKDATEGKMEESIINYIEIIENCLYIFKLKHYTSKIINVTVSSMFNLLRNNLDDVLDHLNMKAEYFAEKEQAIVIERDPAVTAAAEISSSETAYEIIFYNHHTLKGNIKEKVKILKYLANEFEPQRAILKRSNSELADGIAFMLNNMNVRHNNIDPSIPKCYHRTVAAMSSSKLKA